MTMSFRRRVLWAALCAAVVCALFVSSASADVFNMRGTRNPDGSWTGLASLEFVPVGNAGNAADSWGAGYGAVADPYVIGKYAVTAGQYTVFLSAVAATDTHGLYNASMWSHTYGCKIQRSGASGSYTYNVATDYANRPVNFVSFWDAARFVNWLHNGQPTGVQGSGTTEDGAYVNIGNQATFARQPGAQYWIPTENEWYKAAYHKNDGVTGNYWLYPTGSDSVPSNQLTPDVGNNATFYGNGYTIGSPYYWTEVGAHGNSASPYGTFDQGGNAWEWNETAVTSTARGLRGGSCNNSEYNLRASIRYHYYPTGEISDIGFRVASVPEPAGATMLLAGAVVALLWRRRRNA